MGDQQQWAADNKRVHESLERAEYFTILSNL